MSKVKFIDLGKQPIANGFLEKNEISSEFFFNLGATFDEDTNLVSLSEFVDKKLLFHDNYAYSSSMSKTMRNHFKIIANKIKKISSGKILEIGSNDGVFLFNFEPTKAISVEPCGNFSNILNNSGYKSYTNFWNINVANEIISNHGKMDIIYAANCMCHIPEINSAFKAVSNTLSNNGIFIFEDPSLEEVINRGSYDQIYDEHAHIFSILALKNLLENSNLEIRLIEKLSVHGGSNRIYATLKDNKYFPLQKEIVNRFVENEKVNNLSNIDTFFDFSARVELSKVNLKEMLETLKNKNKKIIGYGATSKSVVVYNYCGIDTKFIDYVTDTTPYKQGKLIPGTHIPIVPPFEKGIDGSVDFAFLGAWNYEKEILLKEKTFIKNGGNFITHVPVVRFI